MKNKKWLRSVAFILLLTFSVLGIMQCYSLPTSYNTKNLAAFHLEEENLIEGVVLGTSIVAQSWLTPVAWQEYGLPIYHLATGVQPFGILTEYLNYAQSRQNIKYAVIDVHGLRTDAIISGLQPARFQAHYLDLPDFIYSLRVRKAITEYAREAYDFYDLDPKTKNIMNLNKKSFLVPFIDFHNRWVDGLKKADFVTVENKYMGADDRSKLAFGIADLTQYLNVLNFEEEYQLDDFQKGQLNKLFEYAEENNIELLFVNLPSFRVPQAQLEMHSIINYCKSKGYDTIDFATPEMLDEVGIDPATDFLNRGHLNSKGGQKTTKYICQYLIDNGYSVTDHRGDPSYDHWDTVAEEYNKYYEAGWAKQKKK